MASHASDFVSGRYLSRSWALLTRDSGWVKPVLILSLVGLVPIIGPMAVLGYALEWARLTAWGIDAAPKQRHVDVGQVLVSGLRGTVVLAVWELALGAAYGLLCLVLGHTPGTSDGSVAAGLLDAVYGVVGTLLIVVVMVAQVRSAIYQRVKAGLRADRVLQMAGHDFGGLMHMLGMQVLGWLVELCVAVVFGVVLLALAMPYVIGYASGDVLLGSYALGSWISQTLRSLVIPVVLFAFATSFVSQSTVLLTVTGVALWMRQFDVAKWGRSSDPLPKDAASAEKSDGGTKASSSVSEVPSDAAATRTTTTIVREPGKRPVVKTHTEIIRNRGVIPLGPAAEGDNTSPSDTAEGDPDTKDQA